MTEATLMTEAPTPSAAEASPPAAQPAADTTANQPAQQTAEPVAQQGDGKPAEPQKLAPEKYEFKAPEGVQLDAALLGEFEGVARELDLTQERAQKVVDALAPKVAERMVQQQAAMVEQARNEWAAASKADAEFGGAKWEESQAAVARALERFGSPELRTLLDESGLGNHPEVIRAFVKAGKAIGPDKIVNGRAGEGPTHPRDLAAALYPNQR